MAINVTRAKQQAAEIAGEISQLRSAKAKLITYKSELQANWRGQEVGLFAQSIDAQIAKIDALLGSLDSLSADIHSTAMEIQREEKAAAEAAAARAAHQQQLEKARNAYNQACDAMDSIAKEREAIITQMRNTRSLVTMGKLNEQLKEIDQRMHQAQEACEQCRIALDKAGR